jgi:hypothetical protein
MQSFGDLLHKHRRRTQDPLKGGPLTQVRLGESLGHYLGGAGYTGAAVSDWELNKSKINADNRLVLVSLIKLLVDHGGISDPEEANRLLLAGNYRPLDKVEIEEVFPGLGMLPSEGPASPSVFTPELPVLLSTERKEQLVLLSKVVNFWIRGVLEQSIEDATLIDLARQRCDEAIDHPWRESIGPAVYEGRMLKDGSLLDVFRAVDNALLILGEPGAGKTTAMLQLTKELCALAESDSNQPIPVVLNLISWTEKRDNIADWVIEDLVTKYQIPRRLGREWLNKHELVLLLDGFDEVPPKYRAACAKAINYFREAYGLIGLVICSRIEAYGACAIQLRLGGAILLCPLTATQVDDYLAVAGSRLFALRAAIRQNIIWREMAQSPLMLSVMRAAYSDASVEELFNPRDAALDEIEGARRHLFDNYVQRMFHRRSQDQSYPSAQTKEWLAWLARKMTRHNQTVFLVEKLQPSWLPSRLWQWLYLLITWLVTGLYSGILMWLFLLLLHEVVPWPENLSGLMARLENVHVAQAAFLSIMMSNLFLGLLVGVINGIFYEGRRNQEEDSRNRGRQGWRQITVVGLAVGLVTFLFFSPAGAPGFAVSWGIAEAVMFMIISRYAHGRNYNTEIRTVEALSWSWPNAAKGLGYGILLGALAEVIETWLFGFNGIVNTAFTFLPAGLILGGLRGSRVEAKNRPNEGIRLSLRNAIIAALIVGLSLVLITWRVSEDLERALITGTLLALFALPLFGLSNVTKHYLVRLLLWYKKRVPWRFVYFLDYSARLVLLRKVGGGYIFMHRMLQDFFGFYS